MIESILDTELEYVRCFSKEINNSGYTTFLDEQGKDLYSNNITIIHKEKSNDEIVEIILKELKEHRKQRKMFFNAEIFGYFHREILLDWGVHPSRIDEFDFMEASTESYENIGIKDDIKIIEASSPNEYQDLISIIIAENLEESDKEFALKRMERKIKAYKESNLKVFIAYRNNKAIGSCELLINKEVAKIEDFGVLKEYRGEGIGSYILREALRNAKDLGATTAYVVTSSSGRAIKLYKRCDFKKVGEKSQIIFNLY